MAKKLVTTQRHYIDGHFTNVKALDENHYEGIVATSNQDRMGETLDINGLDTTNFMKVNPIVIFGHNYNEPEYTIGKALTLSKTKDGKLPTTFELFDDIPESKAPLVKKLIKKGVLGLSIGFVPKEIDGDTYTKSEMVEFSVVPVPANAEGAITGRSLGLTKKEWNMVFKGAISTDLPTADENVSWDSGEAIKRVKAWASDADGNIDFTKYRKAFFWVDPENADKQGGYKLPFADIIDSELKAVWRGCAAAMGVMMGARGGVDIPEGDRDAVIAQIKKYYKKFDKEVPKAEGEEDVEQKDAGVAPGFLDGSSSESGNASDLNKGNDDQNPPQTSQDNTVKGIEAKGAVADELAADEAQEQKWAQMEDFWEVVGAFCDVYCDTDTPVDQFGALLKETIAILQTVADGTYSDADDAENENEDEGDMGAMQKSLKAADNTRRKAFAARFKAIVTKADEDMTYLQTVLQDIASIDDITDRLQASLSTFLGVQNPDKDDNGQKDVNKNDTQDNESEKNMSTGYNPNPPEATNTVKDAVTVTATADDVQDAELRDSLKEIEKIKGIDISTLKGKDLGELAEMLKTLSVAVEKAHAHSMQATKADSPATVRKRRLVLRDTRRAATQVDKVVEQVLVELKNIK